MKKEEDENALKEYFELEKIYRDIIRFNVFVFSCQTFPRSMKEKKILKVLEESPTLKKSTKKKLLKDLVTLSNERNVEEDLNNTNLFKELQRSTESIKKIRPSIDKSESAVNAYAHIYKKDIFKIEECMGNGFFDLLTLNEKQIPDELIKNYKVYYKKNFEKDRARSPFYSKSSYFKIFTLSSHYNFHKCFLPGELLPIFKDVEEQIDLNLSDVSRFNLIDIFDSLRDLFYLSRSQILKSKFNDTIQSLVRMLLNEQTDDGLWSKGYCNQEVSDFHIILSSLLILRLCPSSVNKGKMDKLIKWIVDKQKENGSWEDDTDSGDVFTTVFTTVCATEVLIRSGVKPEDKKIKYSLDYLVKAQNFKGFWSDEKRIPDIGGCTAIVLELIQNYKFFPRNLESREYHSRDLVAMASKLSWKDKIDFGKAAEDLHKATEMFFYSVLEKRRVSIKKDRGHTIGLRDAKKKVDKIFLKKNMDCTEKIVENLSKVRNKSIHQGESPEQSEVHEILNQVKALISKYSIECYGYDILL